MLQRDKLSPKRYEYLSEDESFLYDMVKDRTDPDGVTIRMLLEDKAAASRASHCDSRY